MSKQQTTLGIVRDIVVEVNKWRAMNQRHRAEKEAQTKALVRQQDTPQAVAQQSAQSAQPKQPQSRPEGSPLKPGNLLNLLKDTFGEWNNDKAPTLAAALAYYTVFSLAPLLIIAIAVAGLVFGQGAAENQIVTQIRGTVGEQSAVLIQDMIKNAARPGAGIVATIIGVVTLLAGAAGVFAQLKGALNTIWNVPPTKGPGGLAGILAAVRQQVLSFGMVLGIGFLLLVSLLLSAGLSALSNFFNNMFTIPPFIWEVINFVASFGIITLLFAAIYRVLPDAEIAWSDVWIGAALTSLLFTIGKLLLGLYLGRGSPASAYGAAGSLVLILLWVYYSAQILFFGAEFTQVYANRFGSHLEYKSDEKSQDAPSSASGQGQNAGRSRAAQPSRS